MEKSSVSAAYPAPSFQEPLGLLTWSISNLQRLIPKSCQSRSSPLQSSALDSTDKKISKKNKHKDELELTYSDVEAIVGKIGLSFDLESSQADEIIGSDRISRLFEDEEPSLEEVKQAFLVFDMNRDGFIDAVELHHVLKNLGLGEGIGLHECEQMIVNYDLNKDRRMDIIEFTKFLETYIC